MRRLSLARDRELRHVAAGHVAWRWSWLRNCWYSWCRVCSRDVSKQIDWLIGVDYVQACGGPVAPVNVQPAGLVDRYLERYPR